jgi:hypothetical protein
MRPYAAAVQSPPMEAGYRRQARILPETLRQRGNGDVTNEPDNLRENDADMSPDRMTGLTEVVQRRTWFRFCPRDWRE